MDLQNSLDLNSNFCDKPQILYTTTSSKQNSVFASGDTQVKENRVSQFPFCSVQSLDIEVYSEFSRRPIYDVGKACLPYGLQQCFKPCPVFQHPAFGKGFLHCMETIVTPRLKKQRSEKKPVPDEQKDEQYYEKRKRNNRAAKKSRDARKLREDQIAFKAAVLENENALLRTQVLSLREEASFLRHLLMEEKILKHDQNVTIC